MRDKELHLLIVTPEKTVFDGVVNWVELPGEIGKFQILVNHAPLISSLQAGEIRYDIGEAQYRVKKEITSVKISGGFVEVKNNQVYVCVEL